MNSKERLIKTLNHQEPDKLVVDFGATATTGISAVLLHKLTGKRILIREPYQMLGQVDYDLIETDIVGIWNKKTMFGYDNKLNQEWEMPDKTPVLMAEDFRYMVQNEEVFVYPCGDTTVAPSAKMPSGGVFFDAIDRSENFDEENLTPIEDYKDSFSLMTDSELSYLQQQVQTTIENSDKGMIWGFGGAGFGDVAFLPGAGLKKTQGIRRIEDWYVAHILYPEYIEEVFNMQCNVAIENLKLMKEAVGNKIQAVYVSGCDFGTQVDTIISKDIYLKLYKPFHKKVNAWIHQNTEWKTFYHSCGAILPFVEDMIDSGVDILNPVQCSAKGMDAKALKEKFGKRLVFWGGGVDTQKTLPFGNVEEVKKEVEERIEIFKKDGGFVFNTVHNVLSNTPKENFLAMMEIIKKYR